MSQYSDYAVILHETVDALLEEMWHALGSEDKKSICEFAEIIKLFQRTCREYLKEILNNEEAECRSAESSLDLKDAAQTRLSFTLCCDCTTGYPCSCNTNSQLEFWCTLRDKSGEFEVNEIPIKLQLEVNSKKLEFEISHDA